jgi:hypothetical protein
MPEPLTLNTHVITPDVAESFTAWCAAFNHRNYLQPPEFSDLAAMAAGHVNGWDDLFGDDYRNPIGPRQNPLDAPWFSRLLTEATTGDLEALENAGAGARHYLRFFQRILLTKAHETDLAGLPVSPYIPVTFRAKGWGGLDELWLCERLPPPAPPVAPPRNRHRRVDGLTDYENMLAGMMLIAGHEMDILTAAERVRAMPPPDPSDLDFDDLAAGARITLGWSREKTEEWVAETKRITQWVP